VSDGATSLWGSAITFQFGDRLIFEFCEIRSNTGVNCMGFDVQGNPPIRCLAVHSNTCSGLHSFCGLFYARWALTVEASVISGNAVDYFVDSTAIVTFRNCHFDSFSFSTTGGGVPATADCFTDGANLSWAPECSAIVTVYPTSSAIITFSPTSSAKVTVSPTSSVQRPTVVPTGTVNAPSTESFGPTCTETVNAASTKSFSPTSTETVNAASTEPCSPTSTETVSSPPITPSPDGGGGSGNVTTLVLEIVVPSIVAIVIVCVVAVLLWRRRDKLRKADYNIDPAPLTSHPSATDPWT
jgi:hypothetical protein